MSQNLHSKACGPSHMNVNVHNFLYGYNSDLRISVLLAEASNRMYYQPKLIFHRSYQRHVPGTIKMILRLKIFLSSGREVHLHCNQKQMITII